MKDNNLTISTDTQGLLECIDSLNNHYLQTYEALKGMYSETSSCNIMGNEYIPAFQALKAVLHKYLIISIEENIDDTGFKQI